MADPSSWISSPPSFQGGDALAQSRASNQGSFYSPFVVTTGNVSWAGVVQAAVPVAALVAVAWLMLRK